VIKASRIDAGGGPSIVAANRELRELSREWGWTAFGGSLTSFRMRRRQRR